MAVGAARRQNRATRDRIPVAFVHSIELEALGGDFGQAFRPLHVKAIPTPGRRIRPLFPLCDIHFECFDYFDYFAYSIHPINGDADQLEIPMPLDDSLSERLPTQAEAEKAAKAGTVLASHRDKRGGLSLHVKKGAKSADVDLPPAVARLMLDLLEAVGKGDAVTLVPSGADLSTQQAADMLEVSRPFLVKLLETEIPHHKIGTHRRIRAEDLLAYKHRRDKTRTAARTRLARLGQEGDD